MRESVVGRGKHINAKWFVDGKRQEEKEQEG